MRCRIGGPYMNFPQTVKCSQTKQAWNRVHFSITSSRGQRRRERESLEDCVWLAKGRRGKRKGGGGEIKEQEEEEEEEISQRGRWIRQSRAG